MKALVLAGLCLLSAPLFAAPRLAITEFELNDITSLPNTQAELVRTGSMKALLEENLRQSSDFTVVAVDTTALLASKPEFNYLFKSAEAAAALGKQVGADWIVVNQHSKPSFLFSYLMAHLIHVPSGKQIAAFDVELKGNHEKVTHRAIASLAKKIIAVINAYGQKPLAGKME